MTWLCVVLGHLVALASADSAAVPSAEAGDHEITGAHPEDAPHEDHLVESTPSVFSRFGLDTQATTHMSFWFTSEDDDDEEGVGHVIDYETEGVGTWMAAAAVTFEGVHLVGGRIQRPFSNTPEQRQSVAKTTSATTALQDYLLFVDGLFLDRIGDHILLGILSGVRLDYRRHFFHTKGVAVEPAVYAARSGEQVTLSPGDEFQTRADFEDWYLSLINLWQSDDAILRVGVYRSVLRKPHESILDASNGGGRLVVESRMTGHGVFSRLELSSLHFMLRFGDVDFKALGDLEQFGLYANNGGFNFLLSFKWSPQLDIGSWFLSATSHHKITLSPTVGFLFRADFLDSQTENLGIEDDEGAMEILLSGGVQLRWQIL